MRESVRYVGFPHVNLKNVADALEMRPVRGPLARLDVTAHPGFTGCEMEDGGDRLTMGDDGCFGYGIARVIHGQASAGPLAARHRGVQRRYRVHAT